MKRTEVWWVDFDPSVGGKIQKLRSAIIVSNDTANRNINRLQVIPVSSQVAVLYPGEAYITLNGQQRKAMADQLTTVSKLRVRNQLGTLSRADMTSVEQAIKVQLGL